MQVIVGLHFQVKPHCLNTNIWISGVSLWPSYFEKYEKTQASAGSSPRSSVIWWRWCKFLPARFNLNFWAHFRGGKKPKILGGIKSHQNSIVMHIRNIFTSNNTQRQQLYSKEYLHTLETLQRYRPHDFLLSEAFITAVFISKIHKQILLVIQSTTLQARS